MDEQLRRLEKYVQKFVQLDGMRSNLAVDSDIAKLMTEMERDFQIAQIANNNHVHSEVMKFYRVLSNARS
ncbi:hypothetical protein [Paenibacillus mesotrionivorans]|uniref:Uncharacterized protein n=1 Tax=Paenibacillus mesotrionivorans TaxID=3160968 RepID=A0ACC7P139_9BACL